MSISIQQRKTDEGGARRPFSLARGFYFARGFSLALSRGRGLLLLAALCAAPCAARAEQAAGTDAARTARQTNTRTGAALRLGQTPAARAQRGEATNARRPKPAPVRPLRTPSQRAQRRPAARQQIQQQQVVAVVHRLSGWKLRALVAPPDAPIAATFDDTFVRTNIVAGYVLGDGRNVVARLPRAEAEVLSLSASFPGFPVASRKTGGDESSLVLVRADGGSVGARFVGFDAGTGLSLLEADEPFAARANETTVARPAVGQRVRVIAPLPAAADAAAARPEPTPAAPESPDAPVGDAGVLYMSLGEVEGRLKEVRRAPTGRAAGFTVQVGEVSPEWAGGVALNDEGALVGIVEQSTGPEARLLSAEEVRSAAARVKARRASVPQPWLGARGDAVANSRAEFFVEQGWPREQASELLRRQQGVVLTAVAPGTPASRAGLRAGDVISRIENQEVRGVEDMSWILREVGGNRRARFEILRGPNMPMSLQVELSESQNPAFETARAEARAAQSELQRADAITRRLNESIRQVDENLRALDETISQAARAAERGDAGAQARYREALDEAAKLRRELGESQERLREAMSSFALLSARLDEAAARLSAAGTGRFGLSAQPLYPFGVEAMYLVAENDVNGQRTRLSGLMVYAVAPGSAAEQAGLRRGDLVETVDGQAGPPWPALDRPAPREASLGIIREGKRLTLTLKRP